MSTHGVACLRCGLLRIVRRVNGHRVEPGDCPACGYVGWAVAGEVRAPGSSAPEDDGRDRVRFLTGHASGSL